MFYACGGAVLIFFGWSCFKLYCWGVIAYENLRFSWSVDGSMQELEQQTNERIN
jgi:hypothetical protein